MNGQMSALIVATGLVLALPGADQQASPKIHIFAQTERDGFIVVHSKDLLDSVADLKEALRGTATLVDRAEDADVQLEVLGREFQGVHWQHAVVLARLTAGSFTEEVRGVGRAFETPNILPAGWREATNNLAKQVVEWLKANHGRFERVL